MKYRVINKNSEWLVQCKKHWYNFWKTIKVYGSSECAYVDFLKLETNNQCILEQTLQFPHNRIKDRNVYCNLIIGKFENKDKDYNEGKHYYAGYKPYNYAKFYFCSYGKSYEEAVYKLWSDLETRKKIHQKEA